MPDDVQETLVFVGDTRKVCLLFSKNQLTCQEREQNGEEHYGCCVTKHINRDKDISRLTKEVTGGSSRAMFKRKQDSKT